MLEAATGDFVLVGAIAAAGAAIPKIIESLGAAIRGHKQLEREQEREQEKERKDRQEIRRAGEEPTAYWQGFFRQTIQEEIAEVRKEIAAALAKQNDTLDKVVDILREKAA